MRDETDEECGNRDPGSEEEKERRTPVIQRQKSAKMGYVTHTHSTTDNSRLSKTAESAEMLPRKERERQEQW
jgi:hypothetical protein